MQNDPFSGELASITTPRYEERILFAGANGSGKTILASTLSEPYPRVTVLDVKGDYPIPWPDEATDYIGLAAYALATLLVAGLLTFLYLAFRPANTNE